MGLTQRPGSPDGSGTESAEALYARMAGYGFARRFVEGKTVADIGREGLGYGSRLLARSAASVTGLTPSAEYAELASNAYPAPNTEYRRADLSKLPHHDNHFDVVVALGVVDGTDDVVKEARRVLKGGGTLIVSTRDRGALVNGSEGMYAPEFRELLEEHFSSVDVYGLGAVAGGLIAPLSGEASGASVEGASLSLTDPRVSAGHPATRSVLAVCREAASTEGECSSEVEEPYLLLDRDRRLLDEAEDRAEDVELLRGEVRRMQETEVQAFQNSLRLHSTEIAYLRAQIRSLRTEALQATPREGRQGPHEDAQIRGSRADALQATRAELQAIKNSTTWRIFEPYRRLRARMDAVRERTLGRED